MSRNTIDSNITSCSYAQEKDLRVLPDNPVWHQLEPNSYTDFGGQIDTVARNPINASRQAKKGVVTDLNASGGLQSDLTQTNLTDLFQGFFCADLREKSTTNPINGSQNVLISAASNVITLTSDAPFKVGDYLTLSGGSSTKLLSVTAVDKATVTVDHIDDQTFTADHVMKKVGVFVNGTVTVTNNYPSMTVDTVDFTQESLVLGEWVYLENMGFARISSIAQHVLTFDKADAGVIAGGNVPHMFVGDVLKNESDPDLIKLKTYQIERQVGKDSAGTMSEYLVGAAANELVLNVENSSKATADLSFVALDNEQRTGTTGIKSGSRPTLKIEDAFNTSSDISRVKMALVDNSGANPAPLYAFSTDLKLTVNNNVTANKAIGVLGGFDLSLGQFAVTATQTAYFADMQAVAAVRNNADVTLDFIMKKSHNALLFDIPLLSLSDGRLSVTADKPITLALNITGAENKFGYTLMYQNFSYLP